MAASFGIGILCWILLGSVLLNRLFFRPTVPSLLFPTMAIELAPPAVAGLALAALTGGPEGPFAMALGGYAILLTLAQLRFAPVYLKLRFTPAFWAFTFSYAAAAADALEWIGKSRPPGAEVYAACTIGPITVLVLAIAVRTVVALARRQFLAAVPSLGHEAP
jgi:tellurite resistance protein